MAFRAIRGHQRNIEFLRGAVRADRLAHAWIFTGPAGIGKASVAMAFASWQQCEEGGEAGGNDACGACAACRQILAGSHPDVKLVRVEPGKREIGVDRAREIKKFASLAPMHGRIKVAVIDEAHRLSVAAQNALLKTLEDPPGRAALILVSDNADALLPTIRSRCQRLPFAPLCAEDVAAVLVAAHGLDAAAATRLTELCEGSPGRALDLQASIGAEGSLLSALHEVERGRYVDLDTLAQRLNKPETELATKLEILLREMRDEAAHLARSGAEYRPALRRLLAQADHVGGAIQALRRSNPNRQLLLDALMLRLANPSL